MNKPSEQNSISETTPSQDNNQKTVLNSNAVDKPEAKPKRHTLHVRPRDPIDAPLTTIPASGVAGTPVVK